MAALTEWEMRILAFERSWWRLAGAKERDILEVFDVPVTRYYQLLNELIDRPEAVEFDPVLVARLRRQRSHRRQLRAAGPASARLFTDSVRSYTGISPDHPHRISEESG